MAVSLSLLELAERVKSGCVPMLTGAGREGYEWLSMLTGARVGYEWLCPCLLELAERVMSGCVPMLTGAGREGYEWLCS